MIGLPPQTMVKGVGRQQPQQHSALDTLAEKNRGKNGATSMEIQHGHAGWPQKTQITCYYVPSCNITVTWMTFKDIGNECAEQCKRNV